MKFNRILAVSLASVLFVAPLGIVTASAFTNAPYDVDDITVQPNISPLSGFVYCAYDMDDNVITKECAVTYQPYTYSEDNYFMQEIGNLLYDFYGDLLIENYSLSDTDNYYNPMVEANNQIFYINPEADTIPYFTGSFSSAWELHIRGTVYTVNPTSVDTITRDINISILSQPLVVGSETMNVIFLDSILHNIASLGDNLVVNNSYCYFENVRFTFDNAFSFSLVGCNLATQSDIYYSGLTIDNYHSFIADALQNYLIVNTSPPIPPSTIDDGLEAILSVPISFLGAEILPSFTFGDLLLIILGFIVFSFAIKICFGG